MTTSLDYLNIAGLARSGRECFRGASGGSSGTAAGGAADDNLAVIAERLKTALLYTDNETECSILGKAFLYPKQVDGQEVVASVVDDRLSDLAFVDAVLDFGFMRVNVRGKLIEY